MAFFEALFPPRISALMESSPRFLRREAFTIGGQRFTNLDDPLPLHTFQLAHPVRNIADFEELRAFFWAVSGTDGFRFKDWTDYRATQPTTSATLISGSVYQLNRIYVSGSRTKTRPIYKLASGYTIYRTRSGVTTDITGSSTVDVNTGRVTVTSHVALDTYSWAGEFHLPVAFIDSEATFRAIGGPQMLTEWPDIGLRETREYA